MTYDEIRTELYEINPDAVFFEQPAFADALIGWTEGGRAVYDRAKCIVCLISDDESEGAPTADEAYQAAVEFFEYNTLRAILYMGEYAPSS